MEIVTGPQWEGLLRELIRHKGTAILLGAVDSGKSTLARYLIKGILSKGITVSLVDSDIGQSSIGLPGVISMKIFNKYKDIEDLRAQQMLFVGFMNPLKGTSLMIGGTKKMVDISNDEGAEIIIVDTTGLIAGEAGKALKMGKINAIKPMHIVAIQRGDELEHILSLIEDIKVYRLMVSSMARHRSRDERIKYRENKFIEYFKGLRVIKLPPKRLEFFYSGRAADIEDISSKSGTLIGLNHNDDTIGLGILEGITPGEIVVKTPLKFSTGINRIILGDIDLSGIII